MRRAWLSPKNPRTCTTNRARGRVGRAQHSTAAASRGHVGGNAAVGRIGCATGAAAKKHAGREQPDDDCLANMPHPHTRSIEALYAAEIFAMWAVPQKSDVIVELQRLPSVRTVDNP